MADTETAGWVRVRLAAPSALTEGELVLRADRVAVQEQELLFLVGEDVVYRLDRAYFHTLTWFVDRPTFGEWLKGRRAQYPNAHRRWSDDEDLQLRKEITDGLAWRQISDRHGRTASSVRGRAAWLGLTTTGIKER